MCICGRGKLKNKYQELPVQGKATLWFLLCSVLQKGISVLTTPFFTRLMDTSEYGVFNVFLSWQGIVAAIVILTLPWGVVEQGLVKYTDKRDIFTSSTLGLMTTLSLVWFCIYLLNKSWWNNIFSLTTLQTIALFSITWSSSVFTFWSINQRIDYNYKSLVALTIVVSILKPLIGIILVIKFEDRVTARILGLAGIELLFYIPLFLGMMLKGGVFFSKYFWIYVLRFNVPLIPHYLSQRILNSSDRIMIDHMCGSGDAGIYSLAYSLSMIMLIVNQAIQSSLNPWIYRKIKEEKVDQLNKIVYPSLFIVALINLLLIAFAPEAVHIFAPADYYEAIWIIPPVTMSVFFMFLYGFFANIEFYYEKTGIMAVATVIGAVLNIVLNYIFIGIYGYFAAGYTTLACYIIYAFCHYLAMRHICKINMIKSKIFDKWVLIGVSSGFMLLGFLISLTYEVAVVRYSIVGLLMGILFLNRSQIRKFFNINKCF